MHEYSIVASLMERVTLEAQRVGATEVRRLEVRIGEVSGVEIDLLTTAFDTFKVGGLCGGAELVVHRVPAKWQCPRCHLAIPRGQILRCPECAIPASLAEGDDIFLDRIEMEAPDHV